MHLEQKVWTAEGGWKSLKGENCGDAQLVIFFGGQGVLNDGARFEDIKAAYPDAQIIGCSTGGEILNEDVLDGSVVSAALRFDKTRIQSTVEAVQSAEDSFAAGKKIAESLNADDLGNVFIISDGMNVNGSDLIRGLYDVLDDKVIVTGGLAGDAADFGTTYVGLNAVPTPKKIAAIGFYGDALKVGYGSVGGWDPFGPERVVTRSEGNVLFELDGKPALDLYKEYLGDEAEKLPGSALFFPLIVFPEGRKDNSLVRTIVGIDEAAKSMIFAGDIPRGYMAQLMQGEFGSLADGAGEAAALSLDACGDGDRLAILVSCIGRKLLMGHSIADETEAVAEVLDYAPTIGFYSYGEICHQQFTKECALHNQTMTVTLFHES
ncbi:MAG: FIST signal transduction protein [Bdellovibrionales bacterium]